MRWFGRKDDELQEEIWEHIEIETQENIERGMAPEDARRAARLSFGHQGPVRETVQEGRPLHWLHTLWQDLRFGFRMLRR
ncbi:MAG TPA: permease prefix domain 1-containing protein, partial [Alphaproteobacteria bacterium]|nr:permease prefix domain 1-containing protein [Alphaproteobacteria bacterium]